MLVKGLKYMALGCRDVNTYTILALWRIKSIPETIQMGRAFANTDENTDDGGRKSHKIRFTLNY